MMVAVFLSEEKLQPQVRDIFTIFFEKKDIAYFYGEERVDASYIFKIIVTDKIYFYAAHGDSTIEKNEEIENPKFPKWQIRKLVYGAVTTLTGKASDWGMLTGIRPTKVIQAQINKESDEAIKARLVDFYELTEEKADLTIELARKEQGFMEALEEKEASLYVGIPYCPSICKYCSFSSYPYGRAGEQVDQYLDALEKDMKKTATLISELGNKLGTVYIGGGTPTSLNESQLKRLLDMINDSFDLGDIKEFTCEAGRPDTITLQKLQIMKASGVDRISLNPQTMHNKTLERVKREHTVEDFLAALELAKKVGFKTINADLIVGLEEETLEEILESVVQLSRLDINSITIHALAIKRAASLNLSTSTVENIDKTYIGEALRQARQILQATGYEPYYMYRQKNIAGNQENIGYAKRGHACLYNSYMIADCQSIFAVGAGGITKVKTVDGHKNIIGIKDPYNYIKNINGILEKKTKEYLTTLK